MITPAGAPVYVDYAHTPDAIVAAVEALRPHARDRLIIVFGAGGDRDQGKRAEMGEAAARLADTVIVTDDNPRSEDPAAIRRAVLAGAPGATEIGGRRDAIRAAIAEAGPGDIVLLAGKGHEQGQTVGDKVLPFDDVTVAREGMRVMNHGSNHIRSSRATSRGAGTNSSRAPLDYARDERVGGLA